jgi:mono/diheme cytochrome c family protein
MKRLLWIVPLVLIVAVLLFVAYLKLALPDVGPAPDLNVEITPERVERGRYLANHVMACADCHSMRDFSKYSGPVKGQPFVGGGEEFTEEFGLPGNFYPDNLTPFHLGDWTDGEIFRAITSGVSKDGKALFPAMPYPLYNQADKEDIYAVIAYLRTLPATENTVKASEAKFPVSLLINTMPMEYSHPRKPDIQNVTEYGRYMATIAGCVDCHTPMEKGELLLEEAFTGGREFPMPGGLVKTSNITPDNETGIGMWTEEMFVTRFKAFGDSSYVPHDVDISKEFNTLMPWMLYADMKETDLKAIYAFLRTLEPVKKQVVKFSPKE